MWAFMAYVIFKAWGWLKEGTEDWVSKTRERYGGILEDKVGKLTRLQVNERHLGLLF